jgi:hypothetical protein
LNVSQAGLSQKNCLTTKIMQKMGFSAARQLEPINNQSFFINEEVNIEKRKCFLRIKEKIKARLSRKIRQQGVEIGYMVETKLRIHIYDIARDIFYGGMDPDDERWDAYTIQECIDGRLGANDIGFSACRRMTDWQL